VTETKTNHGAPSADDNNLVVRDKEGNPLALGTAMTERESYERVIEGLKLASDAAQHLSGHEPEAQLIWQGISRRLDACRRISVQHAGLGLVIKERPTADKIAGDLLRWKDARGRFREGLRQASGGMRQLATCFRNDVNWSRMAIQIEQMEQKMLQPGLGRPPRRSPLILPPGYVQ
jgi:hypothetical protein